LNIDSDHPQYLRQLGIDAWQRRVDDTFFPGAPPREERTHGSEPTAEEAGPVTQPASKTGEASEDQPVVPLTADNGSIGTVIDATIDSSPSEITPNTIEQSASPV